MNGETLEFALAKIDKQLTSISEELKDLKNNLPNLYISKEVYRSELSDLERRVAVLEANSSKVTWAVLGAAGSVLFTVVKAFLGI
ncbi:hypothetical protein SELR_pSRC400460 (plasmid) [Selenomonas ruminantium subsp. lactilytica TAM6421]|uniref:Haemolysin XhlA n=1 Tax=Selenomonas ruminantium subsp. lactilytica (strain NBRC 103574 / TAM6421) TaxID=927704 RepID=I0GVB0_SELRL|nr:hypothetical protein [Selenomonas ruminantium]BAL84697.1 hypothetical protein SELR_pSRC400460 [Selenomonas ruminantium subsp. lactilytica TAM6421]